MDESLKKDVNIDLDVLRHSTSHLMAQAVKELFPEVKVAIGPAIENGFYYDFDYPPGFTDNDLVKIEERMKEKRSETPEQREKRLKDYELAMKIFKK